MRNMNTAYLHLGCGAQKGHGYIGVDILPGPCVDVVHDLNEFPWPLPSDTYQRVICKDILEHLDNIPRVMEEIYRVTVNGAETFIQSPTPSSPDLFTDPTHLRSFGHRSFDYFDPSKELYQYGYSSAKFRVSRVSYCGQGGRSLRVLDRLITNFANRYPYTYENRFCYIYPLKAIRFVLVTQK